MRGHMKKCIRKAAAAVLSAALLVTSESPSICTKHTADRGTGRCNNRAKQAGRRHCTDRLYFGQLF